MSSIATLCASHGFSAIAHGDGDAHVALSRMAATSSVRSMPTGHQVMQRPQPTQPETSNWSIHEASLCVSHWR